MHRQSLEMISTYIDELLCIFFNKDKQHIVVSKATAASCASTCKTIIEYSLKYFTRDIVLPEFTLLNLCLIEPSLCTSDKLGENNNILYPRCICCNTKPTINKGLCLQFNS